MPADGICTDKNYEGLKAMKRMMIIGPVAAGKTSLIQSLKGEKLHYRKTQAIEFDDRVIDTPRRIYGKSRLFMRIDSDSV